MRNLTNPRKNMKPNKSIMQKKKLVNNYAKFISYKVE